MGEILGADVLLKCLIKEGVRYIFGIPGDQWNPFLNAIYRFGRDEGIEFIMTRHEQAAANMADAWARVTGEVGVCLGTVGPGAANLVSGVYPAWADSIPVLALTAQNQTWRSYPDHGSMQALDHLHLFKAVTKWNAVVSCWERIPELVQRAFRVATSGRPGPVHLDFPADVLFATGDEEEILILSPERYRATVPPTGDKNLIERAAEMLVEAEKPLIHAGGGVLRSGAWDELRELAEYLSSPVTTSVGARGSIPEDHPLCLIPASYGALGAQAVADVVLLVGGRLGDTDFWGRPPAWGEPEVQKLIQIDIDGANIALNRRVDLAIIGDAKSTLSEILREVKRRTARREERPDLADYREAQDAWLSSFLELGASEEIPIHPLRLIKDVREFFPRDAISCVDGGNTAVWAHYLNRIYEPRTFLWPSDSGHLGTGLPYAIGAKLARPDVPVYAICGDGAFMLSVQELETARRLNLPVVIVVANDRAWGMIKGSQMLNYDSCYIGVDFSDVRYDKVAEAMGCYGERVEEPSQIKPALRRAVDSGLPSVLDVVIDSEANLNPPDLETLSGLWLEGCELPW
jgi:acetolactate synthase-1/2/3 large subunit